MKKKEETYQLTFKGLIGASLLSAGGNMELADDVVDNIELYLRRNYAKDGCPAIVFDLEKNEFVFTTVVVDKKKK